jgi:hypothetical protein
MPDMGDLDFSKLGGGMGDGAGAGADDDDEDSDEDMPDLTTEDSTADAEKGKEPATS